MKRLVTLVLAAAFALGPLGSAWAVDVKVSGTWELGIGWEDNTTFTDAKQGGHEDAFRAAQRIRPQFEFITDETLKAVLEFEIGTMYWGNNDDDSGGGLDADRAVATIRRAYLDWSPMGKLRLRMGMQGVALPSATFGNPILDTDVAGVVASYQFTDMVGLTAFWLRPFDRNYYGGQQNGINELDEMDMFGLSLPVNLDGLSITPWAVYARTGNDSGYWEYRADEDRDPGNIFKGSSNMWWAGAAIELNLLDPISINFDGMYGASKTSNDENAPEFSGFLLAALVEYKSEAPWGNPGLIGWYASGDDSDDYKDGGHGKYGRMPVVSTDRAGFAPTNYGFAGSMGCMADGLISNSGVGTWGLGLQLDGFSFIEKLSDKLSHTARVAYIRGTNDEGMIRGNPNAERFGSPYNVMGDAVYLTKEDYALEFNLVTTYKATENLNIYLETHYIKLDLDNGVWGNEADTTDAWKAQILFEYSF